MERFRIEQDTLGEMKVDSDKLWGAQTQRAYENFEFSAYLMPPEIIYTLALVKKAAAAANLELNVLSQKKAELIMQACDEIMDGEHDDQFPLPVWQSGSGTQTNMNINEVIANIAQINNGGKLTDKRRVLHPNDDVNKSQSTNDTFPTAMYIACFKVLSESTLPALVTLHTTLLQKSDEFSDIIKTGRTHLMDATPVTLGQEFSAYASQIKHCIDYLKESMEYLTELAIGGTATGTGLNTPPGYDLIAVEYINKFSGYQFQVAENKFEALAIHDALVNASSAIKTAAMSLFKIANDIRLEASGPRCGIGEIIIPSNEPGSSIMPGKVNPTQCEAVTMVCAKIFGNDATIAFANSQGHFQLNVFKPVMAFCFIESARLLAEVVTSFNLHCVTGIEPHYDNIQKNLDNSLMLVTALTPKIGYEKAAIIAKTAYNENITLREAAIKLDFVTAEEFDEVVNPENMV
ncbi:class II fumarate hydratase [Bacteroidales bacterium OttesenSCG-928-K03]|nr:class II fumarate hydratase [Odoribacter sp. OttesenSCG-928-L07]MDL2239789.1 class II fumarate hydratase [Bacteroidales bacterium OttesenSCG-928-L14]MDL2240426.1 class II fumarate hydratase [Bacteroidales bacterium OttesenSCG-928-K22]MDL2243008.1 class II fumarate hydratase [Bacteroidales bacterium OttesenSCG-928-K03]